jgi:small subunit ribosomal protein S15
VSLNVAARPVANRAASLQVVAANKMSRPNLADMEGPNDTGSSSLQIALLTKRIESLTEHLLVNKKDYACQRGLRMLLGQRNRLSKYLLKKNPAQHAKVYAALGLRTK